MKIRTHTHPVRRALNALWQACEDHQWIPLAVVLVGLLFVNSTLFD